MATQKKNPADATLRNVRASRARDMALYAALDKMLRALEEHDRRLSSLEDYFTKVAARPVRRSRVR